MSVTPFAGMSGIVQNANVYVAAKVTVAMSNLPFVDPTTPPPSGGSKQGTIDPDSITQGEPVSFVVKLISAGFMTVLVVFGAYFFILFLLSLIKVIKHEGKWGPALGSLFGAAMCFTPAVYLSFILAGGNWIQNIVK